MAETDGDSFNSSRAEVFEALGHPTRIRIIQALSERPLPFSELKHEVGLESNGLLSFHLGRLSGLVKLNNQGSYVLTDEGREALRTVESSREGHRSGGQKKLSLSVPYGKVLVAILLIAIIALSSGTVIQQQQLSDAQIKSLNSQINANSSSIQQLNQQLNQSQEVLDSLQVAASIAITQSSLDQSILMMNQNQTLWVQYQVNEPAGGCAGTTWSSVMPYGGYLAVTLSSSTASSNNIDVKWNAAHIAYNQTQSISAGQTVYFPVLPTPKLTLLACNSGLLSGTTAVISVTYFY